MGNDGALLSDAAGQDDVVLPQLHVHILLRGHLLAAGPQDGRSSVLIHLSAAGKTNKQG